MVIRFVRCGVLCCCSAADPWKHLLASLWSASERTTERGAAGRVERVPPRQRCGGRRGARSQSRADQPRNVSDLRERVHSRRDKLAFGERATFRVHLLQCPSPTSCCASAASSAARARCATGSRARCQSTALRWPRPRRSRPSPSSINTSSAARQQRPALHPACRVQGKDGPAAGQERLARARARA
jgi:hypothetical protein